MEDQKPMQLGEVMDRLYKSEINCEVSSFWDGGFQVNIGDTLNGFLESAEVRTSEEAAVFLDQAARKHFPASVYSLGQEEFDRRVRQKQSA